MKRIFSMIAFALAFFGYANAQTTTLWESDVEEDQSTEDWRRVYAMSADEVKANVKAGDSFLVTVSYINPEGGWPQVAMFDGTVGWPPMANEGVGGKECPYVVEFPLAYSAYNTIAEHGVSFSGGDVRISKVAVKKGEVEIGENTIWFGNKEIHWNGNIGLSKDYFADVKVGDVIKVWATGYTQVILGGWSGLNIGKGPTDGVVTVEMIADYATTNSYDDRELNVFELMKANGVIVQGDATYTRIDYIPAPEAEPETNWVNILENGDASGEYGEPACAQNKEQGGEVQPCPITDGVFVAHAKAKVDAEWDNQFWIVSPKACSTGQKMRISFRYKADKDAAVSTQTHKAPSQYLHWDCIGTLNFTNEWQEFSREITVAENMNRMQSIAFNLSKFEEENNYYFDDLKWEYDADQEWVEPLPEWTVPAGEIDLTTLPFSGDCANNIGKRIDAGTPIYGNQRNGDDNVDLTDYECVKIYGNPGLTLRIFVNRSGGEGVTGGKTEQNLTINETGVAVLDIAAVMDATESDHCYLSCIKSGWGDPGNGYVLGITTVKKEIYSRSTTVGNFGTIALRYSASVEGATLYEVESFDATSGLVLSEVDGNMVKGTPYIFVANADAITCTQLDVNEAQATGDWTADDAGNGLVGLYVNWPYGTAAIRGCYVISGNKLRKIGDDATNVTVAANRCFFDATKYTGPKTSEAPKVRIPLEDETNGISDALTEKSLNDGKIYDLNGREVKSMQKGGVYIMGGMKVMVK